MGQIGQKSDIASLRSKVQDFIGISSVSLSHVKTVLTLLRSLTLVKIENIVIQFHKFDFKWKIYLFHIPNCVQIQKVDFNGRETAQLKLIEALHLIVLYYSCFTFILVKLHQCTNLNSTLIFHLYWRN